MSSGHNGNVSKTPYNTKNRKYSRRMGKYFQTIKLQGEGLWCMYGVFYLLPVFCYGQAGVLVAGE